MSNQKCTNCQLKTAFQYKVSQNNNKGYIYHTNSILTLSSNAWSTYSYSVWKNCNYVAIGMAVSMTEDCGD